MNKLESSPHIRFLIHALRFYTVNTPIAKGKYRIANMIDHLAKRLPPGARLEIKSKEGTRFQVDPREPQHQQLFHFGTYDRVETELIQAILAPGDTVLDVGANFGWYTLLFASKVGASGAVHSFEPVPPTFQSLRSNCDINVETDRVFLICSELFYF